MSKEESVHLGDGAYATRDGCGIVLTANHHNPELATDKVYLEPEAIDRLIEFIKQEEDGQ